MNCCYLSLLYELLSNSCTCFSGESPISRSKIHEADSPGRGQLRSSAAQNLVHASEGWNRNRREGNQAIPVGQVVTVKAPKVDRGHCDAQRVPGVVVEVTEHDGFSFHKVAVKGGLLKDALTRASLEHELHMKPQAFDGLAGLIDTWKTLPEISLRAAVRNVSLTGGQGFLKCSCTGLCLGGNCACRKAELKCNSRCHPSNGKCKNHDECDVIGKINSISLQHPIYNELIIINHYV